MKHNHTTARVARSSSRSLKARGYAPHIYSEALTKWRRLAMRGAIAVLGSSEPTRNARTREEIAPRRTIVASPMPLLSLSSMGACPVGSFPLT